jgi:SNARE protein
MVKQLNDYVQRKKAAQADIAARQEQLEAMAGSSPAPGAKKGDPKPDPFAAARDAAEREKTNPFSSSGAAGASTSSTEPPAGADDAGAPGGGSKFSKFSKSSKAAAAAQSEIVAPGEIELQGMQTEELLVYGRDKIKDTDAIIDRSKETVARTIQLGTQTAEQLRNQTEQMEKVVDDLDEIHFSLKKSMKVIKDLTRGLATDKCILTLLFVVVMGVVAIIAVKMAGLDEDDEVASVRRRLLYSRRLLRMEPGDPFEPAHVPWRGTSHH